MDRRDCRAFAGPEPTNIKGSDREKDQKCRETKDGAYMHIIVLELHLYAWLPEALYLCGRVRAINRRVLLPDEGLEYDFSIDS